MNMGFFGDSEAVLVSVAMTPLGRRDAHYSATVGVRQEGYCRPG